MSTNPGQLQSTAEASIFSVPCDPSHLASGVSLPPKTPGVPKTEGASPTFAKATLATHKYATLMKASAELIDDPSFEFERYAAQQTAGVVMRDAVDDFWTGDGSGKPQGLIDSGAGVTTVNQATAGTVVLDDIGALCENVPAASMFTPRSGVLLSPGCYWDLRRQTLGTSAAGGMAVDASLPYFGGTLLGFRFAVDTGLEAPGNGNISAVAGDFTKAYVVRLAPLRVDTDRSHAADTDQVLARVIVRADGQPTAVGNVRALVGP